MWKRAQTLQKTMICCNQAWWCCNYARLCCGITLAAMVCCQIVILHLFTIASVYTSLQTAEHINRWTQHRWAKLVSWAPIVPNHATNDVAAMSPVLTVARCVQHITFCRTQQANLWWKAALRGNFKSLGSIWLNSTQFSSTKPTWLSPAAFPGTHFCCVAPGWLLWPVPAGMWWS